MPQKIYAQRDLELQMHKCLNASAKSDSYFHLTGLLSQIRIPHSAKSSKTEPSKQASTSHKPSLSPWSINQHCQSIEGKSRHLQQLGKIIHWISPFPNPASDSWMKILHTLQCQYMYPVLQSYTIILQDFLRLKSLRTVYNDNSISFVYLLILTSCRITSKNEWQHERCKK